MIEEQGSKVTELSLPKVYLFEKIIAIFFYDIHGSSVLKSERESQQLSSVSIFLILVLLLSVKTLFYSIIICVCGTFFFF